MQLELLEDGRSICGQLMADTLLKPRGRDRGDGRVGTDYVISEFGFAARHSDYCVIIK